MASWRPYLERGVAMFRAEPFLTVILFLGFWTPQALGWLVARSMARSGFHSTDVAAASLVAAIPIVVLSPAFASGVMSLFGEALRGREAGWSAFRDGLGRYYWRVAGAFLLFMLVTLLISIPVGITAAGAGLATSAATTVAQPSLAGVLSIAHHPALAIVALAGLAIQFLVLYWSPAVALGDRHVFAAVASSLRFAVRQWKPTLAAVVLNGIVMTLVFGGLRLLAPEAAPGMGAAPGATELAAQAATVSALVATTLAVMAQAIWQAVYRSCLWAFYQGAGGNVDPAAGAPAGP